MAEQQQPPTVEMPIPTGDDIRLIAEEMSETEMKAIIIQTFRFQQELVAFTRQVAATVDALGDNPMLSAMTAGLRGGNSRLIRPGNGG
jgi:hypothetical protein